MIQIVGFENTYQVQTFADIIKPRHLSHGRSTLGFGFLPAWCGCHTVVDAENIACLLWVVIGFSHNDKVIQIVCSFDAIIPSWHDTQINILWVREIKLPDRLPLSIEYAQISVGQTVKGNRLGSGEDVDVPREHKCVIIQRDRWHDVNLDTIHCKIRKWLVIRADGIAQSHRSDVF